MVTVVDCFSFHDNLNSVELVVEKVLKGEVEEPIERPISKLLIDQLEFANVVVLNKTDLVNEEQIN